MFFWYRSRSSLRKSFLICTFFASCLSAYGQENQAENPLFSIPNKPILGIMTNENSIDDFSFLNNKDESKKSLFAKRRIFRHLGTISKKTAKKRGR